MTEVLWHADAAASATHGSLSGSWNAISGVAIDTREMAPGDLFIALTGEARDGHEFVAHALAQGAGAAMVNHRPDGVAEDAPLLIVDNTMSGLERLGQAGRARSQARVIAITGSVGKTSTKEMMRCMLAGQGTTHAPVRSFNNHWGVPLTLARMPVATEYAVIEIGMNHPGEITPLSRMAAPHVALITTVEAVHLEAFESVGQIADAKAEIFAGLEPDGIAVLNHDNPYFNRLAAAAAPHDVIDFGRDAEAFALESVEVAGLSTVVRACVRGRQLTFKLGAPGKHFALNALGALAAVDQAGADLARAAIALAAWRPPAGRGSRVRLLLGPDGHDGEIELIDESYNANPASMRAALAVLGAATVTDGIGRISRGRRIAILGDMLELGPEEATLHAGLADAEEMAGVDLVHCCGPRMRALHDALPQERRGLWAPDSAALAESIRRKLDAGDVCMVKGSLGARMKTIVDAIRRVGRPAPAHTDEE